MNFFFTKVVCVRARVSVLCVCVCGDVLVTHKYS